jgi:multiple antibiotic resistance protein
MFKFFYESCISLLMIINPALVLAPFLAVTGSASAEVASRVAIKSCMTGYLILVSFIFLGQKLLGALSISDAALKIAGGLLLFYSGFGMVTGGGGDSDESTEASAKQKNKNYDGLAVFPLAFPLIAGPGAIALILGRMATADQMGFHGLIILALSVLSVISLLYVFLRFSKFFASILSTSALNIMEKISGLLIAALSTQMVISGISMAVQG